MVTEIEGPSFFRVGNVDTRPHLSVVQGRRLTDPSPRTETPVPMFLAEAVQLRIEEAGLSDVPEDLIVATLVLDHMDIPYRQKVGFFTFYVWDQETSMHILTSLTGESLSRSQLSIERIHREEDYEDNLARFNFLMLPGRFQVLKLRERGLTCKEISEITGIPALKVDDIGRELIAAGEAESKRPKRSEDFIEFCEQVRVLRDPSLNMERRVFSSDEIATILQTTKSRVNTAVMRLTAMGAIESQNTFSLRDRVIEKDLNVIRLLEMLTKEDVVWKSLRSMHEKLMPEVAFSTFLDYYHVLEEEGFRFRIKSSQRKRKPKVVQ